MTIEKYLDAIEQIPFGKKLPTATYMYRYSGKRLPKDLRAAIKHFESWYVAGQKYNVIKFHTNMPVISFLSYPKFIVDTHPTLAYVKNINFEDGSEQNFDYSKRDNPPILHRKELMVPEDFPGREFMCQVTAIEEQLGLYDDTSIIGTRNGWYKVIEYKGVEKQREELILKAFANGH